MQIQLNQTDIETAVRNYVSAMGIQMNIQSVLFTPSGSNRGITAELVLGTTPVQEQTSSSNDAIPFEGFTSSEPSQTASTEDAKEPQQQEEETEEEEKGVTMSRGLSLFNT